MSLTHIQHANVADVLDVYFDNGKLYIISEYLGVRHTPVKMIGPLPKAPGLKTEITPQEKLAAKKLIAAIGYSQSRNSVFKWTAYLKLLSDLRDKKATTFLLGHIRQE